MAMGLSLYSRGFKPSATPNARGGPGRTVEKKRPPQYQSPQETCGDASPEDQTPSRPSRTIRRVILQTTGVVETTLLASITALLLALADELRDLLHAPFATGLPCDLGPTAGRAEQPADRE